MLIWFVFKGHKNFNFPPLSGRTGFNPKPTTKPNDKAGSYANVVNGGVSMGVPGSMISSSPAMVLDNSCLVERDLSNLVMGKVKDFASIPNMRTLLRDEGFTDVKLSYLGGLWVMFEFDKMETKNNMMQHVGVMSWFDNLQDASNDFVSDERVVWVDIEGIPLNAWSRETFMKIGKKWGETLDLEDKADSSFGRKRLCIKTKNATPILEVFKIIVKGKVFPVRAKELFTWSPIFLSNKGLEYSSDDDSVQVSNNDNDGPLNEEEPGDDLSNEDDDVPETVFETNLVSDVRVDEKEEQQSEDPFKIYDILNKKTFVRKRSQAHHYPTPWFHP